MQVHPLHPLATYILVHHDMSSSFLSLPFLNVIFFDFVLLMFYNLA